MESVLETSLIPRQPRIHRGWWVAAGAFLAITAAGAFSTMAGLLVDPLHHELGWSRGEIGLSVSINMAVYGLTAPFAAALMDRFTLRRVVTGALVLLALGAALITTLNAAWQFMLCWGLLIGLGTGAVALTFAATVTNRWFVRRRGLVSGLLSSGSVLGQFLFLPVLGWIVEHHDWRSALLTLAVSAAIAAPVAYLLLRDHPRDVGLAPYGAVRMDAEPEPAGGAARRTIRVLTLAARRPAFWLLAVTFAVCGASTNGVMWSHFVPAAHSHGMAVPVAASMLTLVGLFNVVGTIGSGWLTDRFDPRLVLAVCYGLRGLSLVFLPSLLGPSAGPALITFAVAFGILDLATVPPTITLCRELFGRDGAIVFGWVSAAHQLGAAVTAFLGGLIKDHTDSYDAMWFMVAALCFGAVVTARFIAMDSRADPSTNRCAATAAGLPAAPRVPCG